MKIDQRKKSVDKPNKQVYIEGMKTPTSKERSLYASYLGSIKSERKAEASRRNGKLGGRPKKEKECKSDCVS